MLKCHKSHNIIKVDQEKQYCHCNSKFNKTNCVAKDDEIEKHFRKVRCPKGHLLKFEDKNWNNIHNINCDECKKNLANLNIGTYRCKNCDFDRCEHCFKKMLN